MEERLGVRAVDNVTLPEQQSDDIYDLLATWGGQGNFSDGGFQGEVPNVSFINPTNTIDVSVWEGSDIEVEATDNDGTIQSVKLLINGEPLATDNEAPYTFTGLTATIQNLSHDVHFLQVIVTDDDGNTNTARMEILGGDPPPAIVEVEEEKEERTQIRVFPNPTQLGDLTIEMKEEGSYVVRIFDLLGRKVDQFKFEGIDYKFMDRNIAEGIYILEIQDEKESLFQGKFMIL